MRRKRYCVIVQHVGGAPVEKIILAYSADGARRYYEGIDWSVLDVYALKRRRAPNAHAPAVWQIDERAIRSACKTLDIRWPVRITRTASMSKLGRHAFRHSRVWSTPRHYITVDKRVSVAESTRVLWHELAHAAQAERAAEAYAREAGVASRMVLLPREAVDAWRKAELRSRKYKYEKRPCEIEATYVSEIKKHYILTKPA
jgi:hypothetical protein